MFGFVRPYIPDLRVCEYELYRSIYCGLCRSMKRHTGELSRLALSYDMTFFAMVRMALSGEAYEIERRRCAVHALHKRPMLRDNEALTYASYVGSFLAWYKLRDNALDERGIRRAAARVALIGAHGMRRAGRQIADSAKTVEHAMESLATLERAHCAVPDEPADVFGAMLGSLLCYGFSGDAETLAREIGRHVGRFVYLADAVCDLERDRASGAYNPFSEAYPTSGEAEAFLETYRDGALAFELSAAAHAVDLIDFGEREMLRACLENIVKRGMPNAFSLAERKEKSHDAGPV